MVYNKSMKMIKRLFSLFLIFTCFVVLSAQEILILEPESQVNRNDRKCSAVIDCNIPNCEVYINGVYKGKTKYQLQDIPAGNYELTVQKEGYDSVTYLICLSQSYTNYYKVLLSSETGFINLSEVFFDSEIYVDSTQVHTNPFEAAAGERKIKVKRFGYEDFEKTVVVEKGKTVNVKYTANPAVFVLKDFNISRVRINPGEKGELGSCKISFTATAKGNAYILIIDSNGKEVWKRDFLDIKEFYQSVSWDGKSQDGQVLEDGVYSVILAAEGFQAEKEVVLTNEVSYPHYAYTKSGLGIGKLPVAYKTPVNFGQLSVSGEPWISAGKNYFSFCPCNLQLAFVSGFTNGLEFSASAGMYLAVGNDVFPFDANFAIKYNWLIKTQKVSVLNAVLLRYGYSSIDNFSPYGIDTGNGLGLGYVAGLKTPRGFAGTTLEFVLGAENGKLNINNNVIRWGLEYSHSPFENVKLDLWTAFNTAINTFNPSDKCDYNFLFCHAMDIGLDVLVSPERSPFIIDTGFKCLLFLQDSYPVDKKGNYFSLKIGLSYLF